MYRGGLVWTFSSARRGGLVRDTVTIGRRFSTKYGRSSSRAQTPLRVTARAAHLAVASTVSYTSRLVGHVIQKKRCGLMSAAKAVLLGARNFSSSAFACLTVIRRAAWAWGRPIRLRGHDGPKGTESSPFGGKQRLHQRLFQSLFRFWPGLSCINVRCKGASEIAMAFAQGRISSGF